MATAKARIGLKSIEIGDVAADGGMGTSLAPFGATVSQTAVLQNDAPTVTDFNIEEQSVPFFSAIVEGKTTITWSSYNVEPASLVIVKGGTTTTDASGTTWNAPDEAPVIEKSIRVTMKDGTVVSVPRANISAVFQWNFQKDKLAQVDLTATILMPTKTGTPSVSIKTPQ